MPLPAIGLPTVFVDEEGVTTARHEIAVAIEIDVAGPHPARLAVAPIVEIDAAALETGLRVGPGYSGWCRRRIRRHVRPGEGREA